MYVMFKFKTANCRILIENVNSVTFLITTINYKAINAEVIIKFSVVNKHVMCKFKSLNYRM